MYDPTDDFEVIRCNTPCTLHGDKEARVKWGRVNRALRKLFFYGYVHSYWFRRNGELRYTTGDRHKPSKKVMPGKSDVHNITYLPRPSKEHDKDKRVILQCYASLRASSNSEKHELIGVLPYVAHIVTKIKTDKAEQRLKIMIEEAKAEAAGAFDKWDEINSKVMSVKYSMTVVFWEHNSLKIARNKRLKEE